MDCDECAPAEFQRSYVEPPSKDYSPLLASELRHEIGRSANALLNLLRLCTQFLHGDWAQCALDRYRCFLELKRRNPAKMLVPTAEIEFVWVCHILRTQKYHADLQEMQLPATHSLCMLRGTAPLYEASVRATARAWELTFPGSVYCGKDHLEALLDMKNFFELGDPQQQCPPYKEPPSFAAVSCKSLPVVIPEHIQVSLTAHDLQGDVNWLVHFEHQLEATIQTHWEWGVGDDDTPDRANLMKHLIDSYDRFLWLVKRYSILFCKCCRPNFTWGADIRRRDLDQLSLWILCGMPTNWTP